LFASVAPAGFPPPSGGARAEGKRISRPPIPEAKRRRIAELHRAGKSINRIHKELGIGYGTAWNYVQALEQG
jgi:hypothetical protein